MIDVFFSDNEVEREETTTVADRKLQCFSCGIAIPIISMGTKFTLRFILRRSSGDEIIILWRQTGSFAKLQNHGD